MWSITFPKNAHRFVGGRVAAICLAAMSFLCSTEALAKTSAMDNPDLVVKVDASLLHRSTFELLLTNVRQGNNSASAESVLNSIVEARLLIDHATGLSDQNLRLTADPVGYPMKTVVRDEVAGILSQLFSKEIEAHVTAAFGGEWHKIASIENNVPLARFAEKTVLLNHEPSPAMLEEMDAVQVGHVDLPTGGKRSLTLRALFEGQNIQGKIALRSNDQGFLKNQAQVILTQFFITDWLVASGLITQTNYDELSRTVMDRHLKVKVMNYFGLNKDIHDDNPALNREYEQVTQGEISSYYAKNKEKFKRIEQVSARHIRTNDEKVARDVYELILDGLPFEEAAARYSSAPDAKGASPGSMGTIHAGEEKNWLRTVVFALPVGMVSKPFRSPQIKGEDVYWELFLVDHREYGYYPPESETVRYVAGKEIAQQKLIDRFKATRARLFETADIQMNYQLIHRL